MKGSSKVGHGVLRVSADCLREVNNGLGVFTLLPVLNSSARIQAVVGGTEPNSCCDVGDGFVVVAHLLVGETTPNVRSSDIRVPPNSLRKLGDGLNEVAADKGSVTFREVSAASRLGWCLVFMLGMPFLETGR